MSSSKLLPVKIWGVAQLLNGVVSIIVFREYSSLVMLFAFVGGVPAIPVFYFLEWLARKCGPGPIALAVLLLLLPLCTLMFAMLTIGFLGVGFEREIMEFCMIPVAATLVSVLLFTRAILRNGQKNGE